MHLQGDTLKVSVTNAPLVGQSEQTYRQELARGYLWSPKRNANGARNPCGSGTRSTFVVAREIQS